MKSVDEKRILLFILVVAFLIRLSYTLVVYLKSGTASFADDWDYIAFANDIIQKGLFTNELNDRAHTIGPSWPLIVAGLFFVFGVKYLPVMLFNVVLSTIHVFFIYRLARLSFDRIVATLAVIWATFYVPFFKWCPHILKENLLQLCFTVIVYLLIRSYGKRNRFSLPLIILAIVYLFFIHADERYFFYLPFLLLSFLCLDQQNWKKGLSKATFFGVILLLGMLPWLFRNYNFYQRPVILTERTASFTDKIFGFPPLRTTQRISSYQKKYHPIYEAMADSLKNGYEVYPIRHNKKVKYIGSMKTALSKGIHLKTDTPLQHYWKEFKEFWRPFRFKAEMLAYGYRYEKPWFTYSNLIYGISFGLLIPLFLLGLYQGFMNSKQPITFLTLGIVLIHLFIHIFLHHVRWRYRVPIDAFIIIISMYGLVEIFKKIKMSFSG